MSTLLLLLATMRFLVSTVCANSVTFLNWGRSPLTIIYTLDERWPHTGILHQGIPDLRINYAQEIRINIPWEWEGNWEALRDGVPQGERVILGEAKWQGDGGKTFYGVSAVDNCCEQSRVHFLSGLRNRGKISGCPWFPCNIPTPSPMISRPWPLKKPIFIALLGNGVLENAPRFRRCLGCYMEDFNNSECVQARKF